LKEEELLKVYVLCLLATQGLSGTAPIGDGKELGRGSSNSISSETYSRSSSGKRLR
jgi:hypothetical protein